MSTSPPASPPAQASVHKQQDSSLVVLLSFCAFFLYSLCVWYATSRVERWELPDLEVLHEQTSQLTHRTLPIHLIILTSATYPPLPATILQQVQQQIQSSDDLVYSWSITTERRTETEWKRDKQQRFSRWINNNTESQSQSQSYSQQHTGKTNNGLLLPALSMYLIHCIDCHVDVVVDEKKAMKDADTVWVMGRNRQGWRVISSPDQLSVSLQQLNALCEYLSLQYVHHPQSDHGVTTTSSLVLSETPSLRLSFSLLTENPQEGLAFSWDFPHIYNTYLYPFISQVSPIIKLTVDSQTVAYAHLSNDNPIHTQNGWFIPSSHLSHFVGNTRWNRPSPLVRNTIELLAFIPHHSYRPLTIRSAQQDTEGAIAFLVPRWGGVVIVNQPTNNETHTHTTHSFDLSHKAVETIMDNFIIQLRLILGLTVEHDKKDFYLLSHDHLFTLADWELDAAYSRHVTRSVLRTVDTLSSLYHLISDVPHMPVSKQIAEQVNAALRHLSSSASAVSLSSCADYARAAVVSARSAFFDPTMVPSLYFPDEHVYAVYAPFFLPILFPILAAIISRVRRRNKATQSLSIVPEQQQLPAF